MLLLMICLFGVLLLRRGDDNNTDRFVEVERITPTALAAPTSIAAVVSLTPTQFTAALLPTPTPFVLAPGSGFIPGGVPTPMQAPMQPYIPPAAPPVQDAPPPAPSNTPEQGYQIAVNVSGDSLHITNRTQSKALTLAPLRVGDGEGAIEGSEWGIDFLPPGACVSAWKDRGEREDADVDCDEVGRKLTREKSQRFWGKDFNVYYNGVLLGECNKNKCSFRIPD